MFKRLVAIWYIVLGRPVVYRAAFTKGVCGQGIKPKFIGCTWPKGEERLGRLRFHVRRDDDNLWRWTLNASNGDPVAFGKSYTRREKCMRIVKRISQYVGEAEIQND